jgi:secreted trypsin-like serine protease
MHFLIIYVGILSNAHGCIPTGHSDIYTRLSAYINWMQYVMKNTTIPMRQPLRTNNASKLRQNIVIFNILLFIIKIFH